MSLVILFAFIIYVVVSIAIIILVIAHTKSKVCGVLAAIFFLLLPTWDVLLGKATYTVASRYVPKEAIYETAETDGIYYENDYLRNSIFEINGKGMQVSSAGDDLARGYKYFETLVTKKRYYTKNIRIPPTLYQCQPYDDDPKSRSIYLACECKIGKRITSKFMVKGKTWKIGNTLINSKMIYQIAPKKLMAEYREVVFEPYYGLFGIPFFNWMHWGWGGGFEGKSCPKESKYFDFQYYVLKVKK